MSQSSGYAIALWQTSKWPICTPMKFLIDVVSLVGIYTPRGNLSSWYNIIATFGDALQRWIWLNHWVVCYKQGG